MIFIMGGNGFVGSGFVRFCQEHQLPHVIIDRNNYDALRGSSCDIFINANGNSKKFLADRVPLEDFDASIQTVCRSLHDFKFSRYVFCSSCDVYPDVSDPAHNKEDADIDLRRISRYGFHKWIAEEFVRYEAGDPLILRCGGFVGPGMKKNAIFDILGGGPLWLNPDSELQFLHTDTAARIVFELLDKKISGTFNLCGNGLIKLRKVMTAVGHPVIVQANARRVVYDINVSKIQQWVALPATEETVLAFLCGVRV